MSTIRRFWSSSAWCRASRSNRWEARWYAWAIPFSYDEAVVKLIADRCTELESGGRMIDSILTNTLLPRISHELLSRMMRGKSVTRVATTAAGGEFKYAFD